jgi:hypothetical protein
MVKACGADARYMLCGKPLIWTRERVWAALAKLRLVGTSGRT